MTEMVTLPPKEELAAEAVVRALKAVAELDVFYRAIADIQIDLDVRGITSGKTTVTISTKSASESFSVDECALSHPGNCTIMLTKAFKNEQA